MFQTTTSETDPIHEFSDRIDSLIELANYDSAIFLMERWYEEPESLHLALGENEKIVFIRGGSTFAYVLESYSQIRYLSGDIKGGSEMARRGFRIRLKNFQDVASVVSENDALAYSQSMRSSAANYLSMFLDAQSYEPTLVRSAANIVLSSKGQVSDGIFARHKIHFSEKDTSLKPLSDSLRYTRFELARLYVQGFSEEDLEAYFQELLEVANKKKRLESKLASLSAQFRGELELREVDAEKVARALPPRSLLIEYVKLDSCTMGECIGPYYLAVLIDKKKRIYVRYLGLASRVDRAVNLYRSHILRMSGKTHPPSKEDLEAYKDIGKRIYALVWKPFEEELDEPDLVFVAPDGALNLISFAGLVDGDGKYLVEKYPIHYLSCGRDLIRLREPVKPGKGLLAMGDPDYDAPALARMSAQATLAGDSISALTSYTTRNVRSVCRELNKIEIYPLPGTREEVESITETWEKSTKESVTAFYGVNASEENFKPEATGKKAIHLATHGYFIQSECMRELPSRRFGLFETFVGENPLLLSGLFLAGANLHGEGADSIGSEDGILTAEEITGMDLQGTRLVVLSACETGLGEIKQGEGVYGLRRAFQLAGARTVVSALWPVSDQATSELMEHLYEGGGQNIAEIMQSYALERISTARKKKMPDHPYFWAPFIAIGDWHLH